MSTNNVRIPSGGGGGVDPDARFTAGLTPKLIQLDQAVTDADLDVTGGPDAGDVTVEVDRDFETEVIREFAPDVVTELGGTLPWDTESAQLQGGETVTGDGDNMNFQLKYRAICDAEELRTLKEMRDDTRPIRLISVFYKGSVTFDQLKVNRLPDANGAVEEDGTNPLPRYDVQLQTRETDQTISGQ